MTNLEKYSLPLTADEISFAEKIILESSSTFFSVVFIKRTDMTLRHMYCRLGVKAHLAGGAPTYDPKEKGLICVWQNPDPERKDDKGYRAIPLDQIISLKARGKTYIFRRVAEGIEQSLEILFAKNVIRVFLPRQSIGAEKDSYENETLNSIEVPIYRLIDIMKWTKIQAPTYEMSSDIEEDLLKRYAEDLNPEDRVVNWWVRHLKDSFFRESFVLDLLNQQQVV